jgi:ABC-type nitrate/sulfonate/bicarbonate transport system permease component
VKVRIPQVLFLILVLIVWFGLTRKGGVSVLILPDIPSVAKDMKEILLNPETYHHFKVTLYEFFVAMVIALTSGLGLGFLLGGKKAWGDVFEPIILAAYAVPIIIIYPLCILFFGIGSYSKIAFAGVYGFFPIVINTLAGVRNVNPSLISLSRSLGAGWLEMNLKIIVPSVLPAIMTGLRMGVVMVLIAVVAGEMLASKEGLGYLIGWASETFNSAFLYGYIILVIVLVTFFNAVMSYLENRSRFYAE